MKMEFVFINAQAQQIVERVTRQVSTAVGQSSGWPLACALALASALHELMMARFSALASNEREFIARMLEKTATMLRAVDQPTRH